jgi:hypothetical protein
VLSGISVEFSWTRFLCDILKLSFVIVVDRSLDKALADCQKCRVTKLISVTASGYSTSSLSKSNHRNCFCSIIFVTEIWILLRRLIYISFSSYSVFTTSGPIFLKEKKMKIFTSPVFQVYSLSCFTYRRGIMILIYCSQRSVASKQITSNNYSFSSLNFRPHKNVWNETYRFIMYFWRALFWCDAVCATWYGYSWENECHVFEFHVNYWLYSTNKLNSVALVLKRTIPTERPPLSAK